MSATHRWAVALAAALALAAPVSAQQSAPADAGRALLTSSLFPTTLGSPRLALVSAEKPFVAPVVRGQARESENVAFMIVGGAALLVGAVIGGDAGTIIMIGGGAVGLVGLYRYLR